MIKFLDIYNQDKKYHNLILRDLKNFFKKGDFILGSEVEKFEKNFALICNSKYSIGCANGTDALTLALMAWNIGPGDAVFVPAFTYVATAEAPAQLGATPFFVDVNEHDFNINIESV